MNPLPNLDFHGETLPENSAWVKDKQPVATIKKIGNAPIVHLFSIRALAHTHRCTVSLRISKTGNNYRSGISEYREGAIVYMFNNCSKLTSLDVTNFNTAKVTDMSYMFSSCKSLTSRRH